jgi:peptidoglycan/xylan/chitin deacetylase (PgdA/CDA1 family)
MPVFVCARARARARARALALGLGLALGASTARAADSAVILMYHHVDRGTPSSTSVTPERFAEHLDYLEREGFAVLPLLRVLEALDAGDELPDKAVALTFDDGYVSVLEEAAPLLKERDWSYTVFVSTDYIDRGYGNYLSWDQLRMLTQQGATIGNHSRTHTHFVRRERGESEPAWRQRIRGEIVDAAERLGDEIGDAAIPALAYPYGEYDARVKEIVAELDLFALGQHSGAAGTQSDPLALPRFPIAVGYDAPGDFSQRVRSRPLPAEVKGDERHVLEPGDTHPELTLEIGAGNFDLGRLACYAPGQGAMELERSGREITARPRERLGPGRIKYNCTAPATVGGGIYYWYSYLWMKKNDDGSWYAE